MIKFFLHVSKEEQADRLIDRILDPSKNWKFEENDVKEREFWNEYQDAFEDCINQTATDDAPWFVVPADDKKNMRLIVSKIIIEELKKLKMDYPETSSERTAELQKYVEVIKQQNDQ